jgi:hypothetical protein
MLKALGHIVEKHGISPDPEKVRAVQDFPRPPLEGSNAKRLRALRAFLGFLSYYRRFIDGFAMLAKPLHDLVGEKGPLDWGEDAEKSFQALKKALEGATRLAYPDNSKPFEIHPDDCDYGIGADLVQKNAEGERPIAFASRLLTKAERNYSITEKECLVLVWAVKKFHSYIWGAEVKVVTDHHALCWLITKKDLAGRLARWALSVQVYQPQIVYKSGRLHEDADALSRYPVTTKGTEDDEDDLLPVFSSAWETEHRRTRECQEAVPHWRKILLQLRKRDGRAHKNFVMTNGLLHKRTLGDQGMQLRLCVPSEQRMEIMESCHGDKWAAHLGMTRTINRITKRYY